MYTYWHHLENLSYQTLTKLWALKSSCEGTIFGQMTEQDYSHMHHAKKKFSTTIPSCCWEKYFPSHLIEASVDDLVTACA